MTTGPTTRDKHCIRGRWPGESLRGLLVTVILCLRKEASAQVLCTFKLKVVCDQFVQNSLTDKDVCLTINKL